ncbi:MAG: leucyl/phenylalanyl-tRNA--protein transferase [Proteobacteria bacterium]|nr:leucyl/phenylalanyl-tRNA--protein transferase [Pseudomonadota bacterium]MBU1686363.1 leucyl/phenylalanyl-tRNA--protein transferase [Pseudomonadota bacterium]
MPVYQLEETIAFPPPQLAREDGLLAVGGDLSLERLILAYQLGIFPWYSPGEPILWWSPDPRLVLYPDELHISRRLARTIRQGRFRLTYDQDFAGVIVACASTRSLNRPGTWLDDQMIEAYGRLHQAGYAHSVECHQGDRLAGGLYGVAMGAVFFGESMFSLEPDASKVALAGLVAALRKQGYRLIDCQVKTEHLARMGAREISGDMFFTQLREGLTINRHELRPGRWGSPEVGR